MSTYVQTDFIYYSYTAVAYSFYRSCYISVIIISFPSFITFSRSAVLARTLSVTATMSYTLIFSCTVSLSALSSSFTYVSSQLSFYAYSAVQFSSYFTFYSEVFTVIYQTGAQKARITAESVIGIVCGAAAAALLIAGIAVFLVRRNSKRALTSLSANRDSSHEEENQTEYVDQNELVKLAFNEDDQWI